MPAEFPPHESPPAESSPADPRPMASRTVGAKTRTYSYDPPSFDLEAAMTMSGLEYMQALAAGRFGGTPSIAHTMGFSAPLDLEWGKAAVESEPGDYLFNPMGTVHGGYAATLLDTVLGISVHTAMPPATGYTTAELKINYTRAILPSVGKLRVEGRVIHVGRKMATAEGRITGVADGKLYAHGSTTCFVFPLSDRPTKALGE